MRLYHEQPELGVPLFFEQMRIEANAEEQIEQLCATDNIEVKLAKVFKIIINDIKGG